MKISRNTINDVKNYMNLSEFRILGLLQEVNRLFFHPRGLAMECTFYPDGRVEFAGIRDHRNDPEGVLFTDPEPAKTEYARQLLLSKRKARAEITGDPLGIQQV